LPWGWETGTRVGGHEIDWVRKGNKKRSGLMRKKGKKKGSLQGGGDCRGSSLTDQKANSVAVSNQKN